jgi:hypothetical protein
MSNLTVIQCPAVLTRQQWLNQFPIFLAGGISNCSDWQSKVIAALADMPPGVILMNPRREDFDISNPDMSARQIEWEHKHLSSSDMVVFWFPWETLCPITLYELGVCAAEGKRMLVGVDPEYQRKFDVKKQLELIRPEVSVVEGFDEFIEALRREFYFY